MADRVFKLKSLHGEMYGTQKRSKPGESDRFLFMRQTQLLPQTQTKTRQIVLMSHTNLHTVQPRHITLFLYLLLLPLCCIMYNTITNNLLQYSGVLCLSRVAFSFFLRSLRPVWTELNEYDLFSSFLQRLQMIA